MRLFFSRLASRQLKRLDVQIQKRILEKLRFYISQKDPLVFAEPIKDSQFGSWKFRIGEHRALFDVEKGRIFVLKIGHRREIYK